MRRAAALALAAALAAVVAFIGVGAAPGAGPHETAPHDGHAGPERHNRKGDPKRKGKPRPAPVLTRYAIVHGCYEIRTATGPIAPAAGDARSAGRLRGDLRAAGL